MTAAASCRIPTNSGSSSDKSPSYTPASYQIPRTINTVSNSYADVSETSESPGSQEQGSSDRSREKSIKRKKADWENQHENVALIDSWKTHFRALKKWKADYVFLQRMPLAYLCPASSDLFATNDINLQKFVWEP